jgi:hypothetical protein
MIVSDINIQIPDEVIEFFFNLPNPPSRIMALVFYSAPNINEYQNMFLTLKRGRRVRLET